MDEMSKMKFVKGGGMVLRQTVYQDVLLIMFVYAVICIRVFLIHYIDIYVSLTRTMFSAPFLSLELPVESSNR